MPTVRTPNQLVEVQCTHKCPDGQHTLHWVEGNSISVTFTSFDVKHGPYCHWCGEHLEVKEEQP